MVKIVPSHPHLVAEYQETILASIDDQDISIRMRALDLVSAMVCVHCSQVGSLTYSASQANRDNLQSIVQQILSHLVRSGTSSSILPTAAQSLAQHTSPQSTKPLVTLTQSPAYRLVLSQRILDVCSQSTYDNVIDFEWYLSVLVDLAYVANVNVGSRIRDQLVDIVGRVKAARRYAVKLMVKVLSDDTFLEEGGEEGSCTEVLWAAAWICGEYCRYEQVFNSPYRYIHLVCGSELAEPQKLLTYLLQTSITNLKPDVIAVYIHAATKIFGYWTADVAERWDDNLLPEVRDAVDMVIECVSVFAASPHIEVQERVSHAFRLRESSSIVSPPLSCRPQTQYYYSPSYRKISVTIVQNLRPILVYMTPFHHHSIRLRIPGFLKACTLFDRCLPRMTSIRSHLTHKQASLYQKG